MENYSVNNSQETAKENDHTPTVEKLSGWVMGLQAEVRAQRLNIDPKTEIGKQEKDIVAKSELEFERRREVRDDPTNLQHGSMVALGEVLADRVADQGLIVGGSGIKQAAKQKKLAKEESRASTKQTSSASPKVTTSQAIQTGVAIGLTIGLLILLWITLK